VPSLAGYWAVNYKSSNGMDVSINCLDDISFTPPRGLPVSIPLDDLLMILDAFKAQHPSMFKRLST
jgi:hypothetical protein